MRPGGGSVSRPQRRAPERHRCHRLPPGPRRGRRHSLRWSWTATTAGSSSRSSRPASRRCGRPSSRRLPSGPESRGHPAPERRPGAAARGPRRPMPSSRTAPCRARSRCARAACAISPRPGTDRRPAPSSTSGPTGCSPASSTRAGRARARLLRLPRLLRAAPGAARGERAGARRERRGARARGRQRRAQRATQHRVARGRRVRDAARVRAQRASGSIRSCSTRRPSPSRGRRCPPRSAATGRSTSAPCAASPPAGSLITASCSFHVGLPEFLTMLVRGRRRQRAADLPAADPRPGRGPSRGPDRPRDQLSQGRGPARRE